MPRRARPSPRRPARSMTLALEPALRAALGQFGDGAAKLLCGALAAALANVPYAPEMRGEVIGIRHGGANSGGAAPIAANSTASPKQRRRNAVQ